MDLDQSAGSVEPVELVECDGRVMVRLSGNIGTAESERLLAAARQAVATPGPVLLDWSAAERIGASAVQILLAMQAALGAAKRTLQVVVPPEPIREYLEAGGLWQQFSSCTADAGEAGQ